MNVHELIDQFVARLGSPERNFQRIDNAPWIVDLEAKLPKLLPASFRSLLARYSFSAFDAGALSFFANLGDGSDQDLGVAIFKDGIIADSTLKSGYIQFARPVSGSYDPVCWMSSARLKAALIDSSPVNSGVDRSYLKNTNADIESHKYNLSDNRYDICVQL